MVVVPTGKAAPEAKPDDCVVVGVQLSVPAGVAKVTTALQEPKSLPILIPLGQVMTGLMVSAIVTVELHVAVLPFTSVTVRITALAPKLEQEKKTVLGIREEMPQASLLPLSIMAPESGALPEPSNWTVMFLHNATGATASTTVTELLQVLVFPFTSVTVSIKLEEPTDELCIPILEELLSPREVHSVPRLGKPGVSAVLPAPTLGLRTIVWSRVDLPACNH
mgnify:CR=1 FL=1